MCNEEKFLLPSIFLTDFAASKVRFFIENHKKKQLDLKFRVYIVGGGCRGFQYCFILDNNILMNDYIIKNNDIFVVVDPMSLQYLSGSTIDYYEGLEGSKFIIVNPNAKTTCSCGLSFSV